MLRCYSDNGVTFWSYHITLQHCGEKLSLFIVIPLGLWKSLLLLIVFSLGSQENVIAVRTLKR
jgi:hypothetical protein